MTQDKIYRMRNITFTSSFSLENHPIKQEKEELKEKYFFVLNYFIQKLEPNHFVIDKLEIYKKELHIKNKGRELKEQAVLHEMITCRFRPWRKKYRYLILCDIALIILDRSMIQKAMELLSVYLNKKQLRQMNTLYQAVIVPDADISAYEYTGEIIKQYWKNIAYWNEGDYKILVTANMSAGKSTLINAIVGKQITRTSQEVCTGNVCYIYSKPFEDNRIALDAGILCMDAKEDQMSTYAWDRKIRIASYFRDTERHICIIDTPGVNSAINENHGIITKETILQEDYHVLLYVLNANKLGTEEEIAYLRWIAGNVPEEKVVFVLNKLDDFKKNEDSVAESIEGVLEDLSRVGFSSPRIYPVSAYFGYLLKKKEYDKNLTEDEEDEYIFYLKKFQKDEYDLSKYYQNETINAKDFDSMKKKCGIQFIEQIVYGGMHDEEGLYKI